MRQFVTVLALCLATVTVTLGQGETWVDDVAPKGEVAVSVRSFNGRPIPQVIYQPPIKYPQAALEYGIYSRVVLLVEENGKHTKVTVLSEKDGAWKWGFVARAVENAKLWKFDRPGSLQIEYRFR